MDDETYISKNQLERYPIYLKYLISMRDSGCVNISAPIISQALNFSEEQVRKDLQVISKNSGKPKLGRDIKELIIDLENFLGYNNISDAIIVGVGHLGEAFMNYKGFESFGINILAGFDNNPLKIGKKINGKEVFSIDRLENLIPRLNVNIAILTTPSEVSQEIATRLEKAGIKAIWNFAPVHLLVNSNTIIEDVNLASSLAILSHKLKIELEKEND
jgi:redox-sensing transcriptional repressor